VLVRLGLSLASRGAQGDPISDHPLAAYQRVPHRLLHWVFGAPSNVKLLMTVRMTAPLNSRITLHTSSQLRPTRSTQRTTGTSPAPQLVEEADAAAAW
jgi:hypothetical protein